MNGRHHQGPTVSKRKKRRAQLIKVKHMSFRKRFVDRDTAGDTDHMKTPEINRRKHLA